MKKLLLGLAVVLGVLATSGKAEAYIRTNSVGIQYDCTDVTYEVTYKYDEAYKLANKINEERAKLGHRQPVISEALMRAAMLKAAILNFEFAHDTAVDEDLIIDGESLGVGGTEIITVSGEAEEAYLNFYESPKGHKQTMLGTMSEERALKLGQEAYMGVGIVNGYTCVLFGGDLVSHGTLSSEASPDIPNVQLTGGTLTNYTELFTAHVYTNRMTPEKWSELMGGIAYNNSKVFFLDRVHKMNINDSITLTGSHTATLGFSPDLNRDVVLEYGLSQHAYSYSVSDPSVLKLNGNSLTAIGTGTATLTMTLNNTNYSKSVTIEVTDPNAAKTNTKPSKTSGVYVKRAKVSKHRTKLSVSWSKVKNASSYTIQVSTDKKFKKCVTTKTAKKCKLVLKKNFKGKKVYVRVRAVNGKKTGPWSKVKTIKTYK